MPLIVDEEKLDANSRPTAIALTLFTMRCMENWKQQVDDYDQAMILVAVVAITSERLMRGGLKPEERRLDEAISLERLGRCNISSIASATGINRETARRKVMSLVRQGLLRRSSDGSIAFAEGLLQEPTTAALIRRQLETVLRLTNDLGRLGVLRSA